MPFHVSTDPHTRITTVVLIGQVHGNDLQLVKKAIASYRHRERRLLIDTAEATLRITAADIQRLAWADDGPAWSIAVFAPNLAAFGLGRMFELQSGDRREVAVFWDHDKAIEWLKTGT
jgi:hypothetical protein